MELYGVITGDVVASTRIGTEYRKDLLTAIDEAVNDVRSFRKPEYIRHEIYRGDSFQIVTSSPGDALRTALLVRLNLRANTPYGAQREDFWDARVAVGVGVIDFMKGNVVKWDGEAFRNSGRVFDRLRRTERLAVRTPWKEANDELATECALADAIIGGWTIRQSQILYPYLLEEISQAELAARFGISPQTTSKLLSSGAKTGAVEKFLERYTDLIENHARTY